MTFKEWLKYEGYYPWTDIREHMIIDGHSEVEISIEKDNLWEQYEAYCDEEGISPED